MVSKQVIYANLEDLYCYEPNLNGKEVMGLIKLGSENLEKLLEMIRLEPLEIDFSKWDGKTIMELTNGDEFVRALYELGIRIIPVIYDADRINKEKLFGEVEGYTPIKVKDTKLLDEEKYNEYCRLMYGTPDWEDNSEEVN
jgi:hypothetical protein